MCYKIFEKETNMKKTFKSILLSSFVVLSFVFAFVLTGCNRKTKTTAFSDKGEVGEYYSSALAANASLALDKNAFTFTSGGTTLSGTYSFDGTTLVLTFDGDSSGVNVTFGNNQISFTYKGETYTLYKNMNFTVSFNTNGGSSVASQTVKNGQKATMPAAPTKEGNTFIGWYKDSAFNNPYNFDNEVVTANTTLYAYFGENTSADDEFTVKFVNGSNTDTATTFHNTLYTLPTAEASGKNFLGWWVSDYDDPSKLSYKFETGMELSQDTTMYAVFDGDAPAVSVVGNKIEWDSKGIGKSYNVTVKNVDGAEGATVYNKTVTTTSDTFNFANADPGNYIVEVSTGAATGRAYVINKGLSKVSKFSVDGFTLTWNKVPNATSYSLVIDNQNPNQSTTVELGNVNTYDFTNLTMPSAGINFTVVASANGFVSSTSSAYNLFRGLPAMGNVNYDSATQSLTWDAVQGATSYTVEVTDANNNTFTFDVTTTSFAMGSYYGNVSYTVTPAKAGYYAASKSGSFDKAELATPKNISMIGYDVTWDAVSGATSYSVTINGETFTTTTNSYTTDTAKTDAADSFAISVTAIAANAANNSLAGTATINKGGVSQVSYANGVVSWNSVPGATNFVVKLDNGDVKNVSAALSTTLAIESGKHSIYVAPADSEFNYKESDFFKYDVDVYALTYNTMGGTEIATYYYVKGDNVPTLPTPQFTGYGFMGWYVSEDAARNNGDKFTATTFDNETSTTIYAGWKGNEYTVTFNYTDLGVEGVATQTVTFGSSFSMPVPQSTSPLKAFNGWYAEINSQGYRFTDQNGNSREGWKYLEGQTLYAGWIDVFSFELSADGNSYSVMGSEGASYLTEVTIPDTYNGKPVLTVEAYAFKDYTKLVKIIIPNTIQNIETGNSGPDGTGSAFKGCVNLTGIYIYEVEGAIAEDVVYSSVDGVLIYKNNITNDVEIKWVPFGTKTGTYTIPSTVTSIAINTFNGCNEITKIIIPASVKTINDSAFYGCRNLESVEFMAAAEGATESPLALGEDIFKGNSLITTIDFPARVSNFSASTLATCTGLTAVNFVGTFDDAPYKSVDGVVYNAAGTILIYFPRNRSGEFVIPTGVTTIGESAFETARYVSKITIPGHVTTIEKYAFKTCSRLSDIVFQGVASDPRLSIGEQAFYNAGNFVSTFTELVLPANLQVIEKYAFGSMTNITSVKLYSVDENISFAPSAFGTNSPSPQFKVTDLFIGKDVHSFEVAGVFGATKLERVVVEDGNQYFTVISGVLYNKAVTAILYYPSTLTGAFSLPETITTIGERVFEEKYGMTAITLSNKVTSIGNYAFLNCTNLQTVTFGDDGTDPLTIGNYAFSNCKSLTSFTLPARTTTVGIKAFESCTALTTVNVNATAVFGTESNNVTIGRKGEANYRSYNFDTITAFDGCTALTAINVDSASTKYESVDGVLCTINYSGDNPTGFITVSVCPMAKTGTLALPATVDTIDYNSFNNQKGLTAITFPQGVTSALAIQPYAFRSASFTSIELPSKLTQIESFSFMGCTSLTAVTIPNTVTLIQSSAFSNCTSLATVTFETGGTANLVFADGDFKYMGSESDSETKESTYDTMDPISIFAGCNAITELVLPERTTTIGKAAFGGMMGLTRVVIPSTVTSIGDYAFVICQNLQTVEFAAGCSLTNLGQGAFRGFHSYEPSALSSINLPSGTYTIGAGAFKYTSLTSVTVPEGVTALGTRAFYGNKKLTTVSLPASLTTIGNYAFSDNKALSTVTFASGSQLTGVGSYAFSSTAITSFAFPTTITQIAHFAFANCTELSTVTFASGTSNLSAIGTQAFANTAITSFSFPSCGTDPETGGPKIIAIGGNVTLSSGSNGGGGEGEERPKEEGGKKEKEGEKGKEDPEEPQTPAGETGPTLVFNGCKNLTTVYISESVASIDQLFVNCPALTTVTISASNQNLKTDTEKPMVINLTGTAIRYVYGKIVGEFVIPAGVTEISPYAFDGQTEMTKVTIPASVVTMGDYAFRNCYKLATVEFAEGATITTISNYAFQGCKSLTSAVLPGSVTTIGNYAFAGCEALSSFTFPANLANLGDYAFANCGFTTVTVPSIATVGKGTFAYNTKLTSATANSAGAYMFANDAALAEVTIGNVSYLGEGMFQNCTALTAVTIPASVFRLGGIATTVNTTSNIPGYVFDGCTSLATVNMNETCIVFGSYSFRNCTSLTTFTFPNTETNLGEHIFDGCTSLESVSLSTSGKYIAQFMFYNCTSLTSITMPESVEKIGGVQSNYSSNFSASTASSAFYGCTSLATVEFSSKVNSIGSSTFFGCTALTEITLPASLIRIGTSTFENCTSLEKVTYTQTAAMTTNGNYIYRGCTSLKEVNNYKSYNNSIGFGTFVNCTSLESFKVPSNIRTTGNETFMGCTSLKDVDFSGCTDFYQFGTSAFEGCTSLSSVRLASAMTISQNFSVGGRAFTYCSSLEDITFPALQTGKTITIGYAAFMGTALKSFQVTKDVSSIAGGAFNNCNNISFTIDSSVTKYALLDDMFLVENTTSGGKPKSSLVSIINATGEVTLPDGLEMVSYSLFGLDEITRLTLPSTLTTIPGGASNIGNNAVIGYKGGTVVIPEGVTTINGSFFNSTFESIELPSSLTSIGSNAFANNTALKSIVIPASVEKIDSKAFYGCTALESVTFTNGLVSIGENAFEGCTSLTSVTFPETLTTIGNSAFKGTGLTSVVVPANVTVGKFVDSKYDEGGNENSAFYNSGYVFANCTALTTVTYYPTSINSKHMFEGCTALTTVSFPNGSTSIDGYAFSGCSSLATFPFAEGLINIGAYAFSGTALTTVSLPASLGRLCDGAFANCKSLTTVTFSDGIKYIGAETVTALDATSNEGGVFEGCSALANVTLPATLFAINGKTFAGCTSIASIVLPNSVSFVGDGAFAGWTSSQTVNSTQSLYTITGLWAYETNDTGAHSFMADSNATFVWDYSPSNASNDAETPGSSENANDGAERP